MEEEKEAVGLRVGKEKESGSVGGVAIGAVGAVPYRYHVFDDNKDVNGIRSAYYLRA